MCCTVPTLLHTGFLIKPRYQPQAGVNVAANVSSKPNDDKIQVGEKCGDPLASIAGTWSQRLRLGLLLQPRPYIAGIRMSGKSHRMEQ